MYRLFLKRGAILILCLTAALRAQGAASTAQDEPAAMARASIYLDKATVLVGQKVWATFTITNLIDEAVGLQVPGAQLAEMPTTEVGLPLAHIFSGRNFTALRIEDERGVITGETVTQKPVNPVPLVTLAPHASVGMRVDLSRYYEIMKRPGSYKLTWNPYEGILQSEPASLTIMARQRAKVITDLGTITMEFYYDAAPNHVRNFTELAREGFYDNKTFHRVIPGGLIQGGSPTGDNKGALTDRTLKAEFSKIPFEFGTVGMARSPQNPDSASCQFFICLGPQPSFVGNQTAFAKVVGQESFETLKKIGSVPTKPGDRPLQPVAIKTISLENIPERLHEAPLPKTGVEGTGPHGVVRLSDPVHGKAPTGETPDVVKPTPTTSQAAEDKQQ